MPFFFLLKKNNILALYFHYELSLKRLGTTIKHMLVYCIVRHIQLLNSPLFLPSYQTCDALIWEILLIFPRSWFKFTNNIAWNRGPLYIKTHLSFKKRYRLTVLEYISLSTSKDLAHKTLHGSNKFQCIIGGKDFKKRHVFLLNYFFITC